MFNSQNLGAMIVKKDPEVKSWEDNQYNIQSMAVEEEYGFGIINEGQAIAVARNVKVRPNEFVMPARTVFNLSVRLIVQSCPVSGIFLPEIPRFSLSLRDPPPSHLLPPHGSQAEQHTINKRDS